MQIFALLRVLITQVIISQTIAAPLPSPYDAQPTAHLTTGGSSTLRNEYITHSNSISTTYDHKRDSGEQSIVQLRVELAHQFSNDISQLEIEMYVLIYLFPS